MSFRYTLKRVCIVHGKLYHTWKLSEWCSLVSPEKKAWYSRQPEQAITMTKVSGVRLKQASLLISVTTSHWTMSSSYFIDFITNQWTIKGRHRLSSSFGVAILTWTMLRRKQASSFTCIVHCFSEQNQEEYVTWFEPIITTGLLKVRKGNRELSI